MISEPLVRPASIAFRLRRQFPAARENVFRAWTQPEVLKQWWCPAGWTPAGIEIDLRPGGTYRIGMCRLTGGLPIYVSGRFVEVQAPDLLVYTWRWENAFPDMPETRVTVHFVESAGGTQVVLTHQNLPEIRVCLLHRAGWIAAWDRIERLGT